MFHPTIAFWFSLSPLPVIWFLNIVILLRMQKVRRLAKNRKLKRPKIYVNGTIINLISFFFVILPALVEWRIFVQNPYWIIVYLAAGVLNIIGLSMMSRGLDIEMRSIKRRNTLRAGGKKASKRRASTKPLTIGG